MKVFETVPVIIPSLSPDERMIRLVQDLSDSGFENIILVNDGSGPEYNSFFERANNIKGCTLLTHNVNLGKGRALKTAFNYILSMPEVIGSVTADSDGQHNVEDIIKTAQMLEENPGNLVLGVRDFDLPIVPVKSRLGNKITRSLFSFLSGVKVSDTQTGLRGISVKFMRHLMNTGGERFDFEMNMLLECRTRSVAITEVPIATIYENQNASTHFNPLLDSVRVYLTFLKYIASSVVCFSLDILVFSLIAAFMFSQNFSQGVTIAASTFTARALSSLAQFSINYKITFKDSIRSAIRRYYLLVFFQMLASFACVSLLLYIPALDGRQTVVKIVVDMLLFIVSYKVQLGWVFKNKKEHAHS